MSSYDVPCPALLDVPPAQHQADWQSPAKSLRPISATFYQRMCRGWTPEGGFGEVNNKAMTQSDNRRAAMTLGKAAAGAAARAAAAARLVGLDHGASTGWG